MLDKLTQSLSFITEQNKNQQSLMLKLTEVQIQLHSRLSAFPSLLDEESLKCLQNIDRMLAHSLQFQREGREEFLNKLKKIYED